MNNDNNFDINSIINGTPGSNPTNSTPNGAGTQNQFPGGVTQQPVNQMPQAPQVPFTTGVADNMDAVNNMSNTEDPNAMVNENLKKVEIHEYKPPGKYQMFLLFVFFIFIICFALFLPEISSFINLYKSGKLNQVDEEITSGKLTCTLKTNTANLDMDYVRVFYFDNKSLNRAEFTLTTRGDPTEDEQTLANLTNKCKLLKEHSQDVNGLIVSCEESTGQLVEVQSYKYSSIDSDSIKSAFAEIGGTVPEFTDGEDIEKIEHNMNAAGYSCLKEK